MNSRRPTSPSRQRSPTKHTVSREHCLFCGLSRSEKFFNESVSKLVCAECFAHIGKLFAKQNFTPILVRSEKCISCGRSAAARLLVSGVAAAICRGCYIAIKNGKRSFPTGASIGSPKREQLRDLSHSRTVWVRAHRQYARLDDAIRSLGARYEPTRFSKLMIRQVLAGREMEPPLSLVTSREQVRGRPALTLRLSDGSEATSWRGGPRRGRW